jgi:putative membrane-bound dehydrogenase-like protein
MIKAHFGRRVAFWLTAMTAIIGQAADPVRPATDAPQPLSPEESARRARLPPGFRLEIVASEPLIREPTGMCWDARGRLFVCELHGYNLEGDLDVQELNKTGQLDREVRRIPANDNARKAAEQGTYGTVKLLTDTDGDGRMDKAEVFADRLPPCYGIVPALGGVIVAAAPDIVFLADRDGDGRAEERVQLFTGFATGALERGINAPQWGLDGWIYCGRGHGGGTITGPHLAQPVRLGGTDFRFKADGSAIEPITGATHTFGFAFTESGERFVMTTSLPGIYVAPLPWRYLARNPDAAAPATEQGAADYTRVFPIAPPHPWRVQRAADPGFFKYYRDRYGVSDSEAGGYFTSGCGPLVYQDVAFPAEYRGQFFMCEPAQNLIHRAVIEREGPALRLRRASAEAASEFLASGDQWFHPMNLVHGPDGGIYAADFYREIIEDYSAVPRYLQQQYGLSQGINHGRVWRITHRDAPQPPPADMSGLDRDGLVKEVGSPHFWRRETARRLLVEHQETAAAPALARLARGAGEASSVLNALQTLDALGQLEDPDVMAALEHPRPGVRVHGLQLAERWLDTRPRLLEQVLALADDPDASVVLQLALTLGETKAARVLTALAALARAHGEVRWMPHAIVSSVHQRGGLLLAECLGQLDRVGQARAVLEPLLASIAARHDEAELGAALELLARQQDAPILVTCLRGMQAGLKNVRAATLTGGGRAALGTLLAAADGEVRRLAALVAASFKTIDPAQARLLLAQAERDTADLRLAPEARLAAVALLGTAEGVSPVPALLAAWPASTPAVRAAILDAMFARRERLPALLEALENRVLPVSALTAFQRLTLLEHDQAAIRERAARLMPRFNPANDATFQRFAAALGGPRDPARGEQVFREHCATCHLVRGIGFAVGPDLGAEFQRAEQAILRDVLAPNDSITAGYPTYVIETTGGQSQEGILVNESATSLTLRQAAGVELVFLRKDVARLSTVAVSLMPEALKENLTPEDAAAVIAWLRGEAAPGGALAEGVVLFDEEPAFVEQLNQGDGRASLEEAGAFAGRYSLLVAPPQRYAARIPGWRYRIVEQPKPGEYRYLRLAWRARGAQGVMLELAADGAWPEAQDSRRRYYSGRNTTRWEARELSPVAPAEWTTVTVDLWKDNGAFTLTGIAPTAMGGPAAFDRMELLRRLENITTP